VLAEAATRAGGQLVEHPLMEKRDRVRTCQKRAVIWSAPTAACAARLNSNLFREAAEVDKTPRCSSPPGKAAQFIARTKRSLAAEFTYKDTPQFAEARAISKFAQDLFLKGEVDAVDILFTNFINTLTQQPKPSRFCRLEKSRPSRPACMAERRNCPPARATDIFEFEPDETTVLGALLPHSLNFQMHQILLEAKASEHSARMVAMKNATDNAQQLIKDLTLEYNKLRQANITKELLEITTAQMAVG
jgi:F-type H+-transporting ATPase subunit gamma